MDRREFLTTAATLGVAAALPNLAPASVVEPVATLRQFATVGPYADPALFATMLRTGLERAMFPDGPFEQQSSPGALLVFSSDEKNFSERQFALMECLIEEAIHGVNPIHFSIVDRLKALDVGELESRAAILAKIGEINKNLNGLKGGQTTFIGKGCSCWTDRAVSPGSVSPEEIARLENEDMEVNSTIGLFRGCGPSLYLCDLGPHGKWAVPDLMMFADIAAKIFGDALSMPYHEIGPNTLAVIGPDRRMWFDLAFSQSEDAATVSTKCVATRRA